MTKILCNICVFFNTFHISDILNQLNTMIALHSWTVKLVVTLLTIPIKETKGRQADWRNTTVLLAQDVHVVQLSADVMEVAARCSTSPSRNIWTTGQKFTPNLKSI